jgi:ABC-2 type transport system permease protein
MKLRHINAIANKELHAYLNAPLGYIFITVFLVVSSWLFFDDFFLKNAASMRDYFDTLPFLFLFLIPAVTMRLWSEERKIGTDELLLTAPVTPFEVVIGKYVASFFLVTVALILSVTTPAILFFIGQPDWGAIAGGYLGALFLAGSYLAIGLFVSSTTNNQIVAFIMSVVIIFILLVVGNDLFLRTLPDIMAPVLKHLSLDLHFKSIVRGVIDTRDLVYYATLVFLFLYFNVWSLQLKKWK